MAIGTPNKSSSTAQSITNVNSVAERYKKSVTKDLLEC